MGCQWKSPSLTFTASWLMRVFWWRGKDVHDAQFIVEPAATSICRSSRGTGRTSGGPWIRKNNHDGLPYGRFDSIGSSRQTDPDHDIHKSGRTRHDTPIRGVVRPWHTGRSHDWK